MYEYLTGVYSALASIFGKLSLSSSDDDILVAQSIAFCNSSINLKNHCTLILSSLRITSLIGMLACNIFMLSSFLKALSCKGSLHVTVISSSVSFLLTGILGSIVLGEKINLKWFIGALLIALGVSCIASCSGSDKKDINNIIRERSISNSDFGDYFYLKGIYKKINSSLDING
jgi:uncharacterized membrane protein